MAIGNEPRIEKLGETLGAELVGVDLSEPMTPERAALLRSYLAELAQRGQVSTSASLREPHSVQEPS